ncbi:diguanylate cyclase [Tateyamaria sp. SN6-1]|uniref:diguanylate cyclase n=1 Tax=Tateyamaria sp. SN6-1 TaxID=3092148 RepID=UPI0039F5FD41
MVHCVQPEDGEPMMDKVLHEVADRAVPQRVFRLLLAMGVCAVTAIIILANWMTRSIDDIAADHTARLIDVALRAEQDSMALLTADYTDWELGFDIVQSRSQEAVHDNIGSGATESGFFDEIMIWSGDTTPLFAYRRDHFESDLDAVRGTVAAPFLAAVRATDPAEREVVSGAARDGNDVLLVTAARFLPDDLDGYAPDAFPVMVAIRIVDRPFLVRLCDRLLLHNITFGSESDTAQASVTLYGLDDAPVATLRAQFDPPGTMLMSRSLVVVLALSGLLALGSLIVGRVTSQQTHAYLQEHMQARTDPLTGLINRAGLDELVQSDEVRRRFAAGHAAVLYLDLNKFKALNDAHGHDAGDKALRKLAQRLQDAVRRRDAVARLGGDEFALLLFDARADEAARRVCHRLQTAADQPVDLGQGVRVRLVSSIGVAIAEPGANWNTLLMRADAAMYRSKRAGYGQPVFYDPSRADDDGPMTTTDPVLL